MSPSRSRPSIKRTSNAVERSITAGDTGMPETVTVSATTAASRTSAVIAAQLSDLPTPNPQPAR